MSLRIDEQLIAQIQKGDRQAMQDLAERHRNTTFRVAFRALGNRDDALDVSQEALIYGIQHLGELRDKSRFSSWIQNVTLSRCVDYRRRRGTRRMGPPISILDAQTEEINYAETLAIQRALCEISEPLRTTVLLHYQGGYSLPEVAQILCIPVNTVRSRLMAAKKRLTRDLLPEMTSQRIMQVKTSQLSPDQISLINSAFPGSKIKSVQPEIESWMPFTDRVTISLPGGETRIADFRSDLTPDRLKLLQVLTDQGIPGPQLIVGPVKTSDGAHWICLTEPPQGENLLLWSLGGTPHRIRLATERAFQAIQKLSEVTPLLEGQEVGASLARRTLADEIAIITEDDLWNADPWLAEEGKHRKEWLQDPWFVAALEKIKVAAAKVTDPLVYTHYSFFFPLSYRILSSEKSFDEPLGAPGDPYFDENPLCEYVQPFGYFGDPFLGLAMVLAMDCYPFVHTGFVEQYLWRSEKTRRDFAPRLGICALRMVARDLALAPPQTPRSYWSSLRGWVDQALQWQ